MCFLTLRRSAGKWFLKVLEAPRIKKTEVRALCFDFKGFFRPFAGEIKSKSGGSEHRARLRFPASGGLRGEAPLKQPGGESTAKVPGDLAPPPLGVDGPNSPITTQAQGCIKMSPTTCLNMILSYFFPSCMKAWKAKVRLEGRNAST